MSAIAGRVLPLPKGVYNAGTTYNLLDIVYYNNASYIAKGTTLGNLPTDTDYWQVLVDVPSTANITPEGLGIGYGVSDTAESDVRKVATLTDYNLRVNGIVAIKFNNNVPSSSLLNINNKGAKPIYDRGLVISDGVIKAGDTATFVYDGTSYNLLTLDRAYGNIGDLDNVDLTGLSDGQTLVYDGVEGKWKNGNQSNNLSDLNDVSVASIQADEVLTFDGTANKWKNETIVKDLEAETGNPLSFNTDSEQVAQNTVITLEPIQSGSGDASPSNVRTISGRNVVEITLPLKNLFNLNAKNVGNGYAYNSYLLSTGAVSGSHTRWMVSEYIMIQPNTNYVLSNIRGNDPSYAFYTENYDLISATAYSGESTIQFTTPANARWIRVSADTANYNTQLEIGNVATEFEPYNSAYDVVSNLPETIYGGTYDVEKGLLTVTQKRVDMGSLDWQYSSTGQYFQAIDVTDKKRGRRNISCEIYKTVADDTTPLSNLEIGSSTTLDRIFVCDSNYTVASDFITAVTGKYIVYELKTPIEITLHAYSVKLLSGANVVTTNGTSMSLTYRNGEVAKLSDLGSLADAVNSDAELISDLQETRPETDKTIAPKQGATASRTYYIGQRFIDADGYLGTVITTVNSGSAWTLNTNYKRSTIGDSLYQRVEAYSYTPNGTTDTYGIITDKIYSFLNSFPTIQALMNAQVRLGGFRFNIDRFDTNRMILSCNYKANATTFDTLVLNYDGNSTVKALEIENGTITDISANLVITSRVLRIYV